MKKHLTLYLAAALTLFSPALCLAQAKIYTKKACLASFGTSTVKAVAEGDSFLAITVREQLQEHWKASPLEFCTAAGRDSLLTDGNLYFLNLEKENGVVFLSLTKGGQKEDKDMRKRPLDVVRMPVAGEDGADGMVLSFIGTGVDIIQHFVASAKESDAVGYSGLKSCSSKKLDGRTVITDPEAAEQALMDGAKNTAAAVVVAPGFINFKTKCYKMLVDAQTHELLYYAEAPLKDVSDAAFTEKELKLFVKRGGRIAE